MNRTATGRDPLSLCIVCGKKVANLGTHLPTHSNLDAGKISTYCKAQFTRGMRGPVHLPTIMHRLIWIRKLLTFPTVLYSEKMVNQYSSETFRPDKFW